MNKSTMFQNDDVVAVIPALNEERTIRQIVLSTLQYCQQVIVVDDGSTDATSSAIADLAITLLRHQVPMGKGRALKEGFRRALEKGCKGVITLDADGQHSPDDIPLLLAAAVHYPEHAVIGARLLGKENQPKERSFANAVADWFVSWVCGQRLVDTQSGQRYYPRYIVELSQTLPEASFVFESELLIEASWHHGMRAVAVPIEARYQQEFRPSHFRPWRDIAQITRMISGRLIRRGLLLNHLWRLRGELPLVFDPDGRVSPSSLSPKLLAK